MVRHVSLFIVLLALASSGCDTQLEPCTESCPDISGAYSVQNATPVGQCPFSAYLLAPTVELLQSDDRRKATLHVIDPSSNLEVHLTGDVYARGPKDSSELLGSFQLNSSVVRPASQSDKRMMVLDVSATGSVSLHGDRRVLSVTLSTTDITQSSNTGCSTSLAITGKGELSGRGPVGSQGWLVSFFMHEPSRHGCAVADVPNSLCMRTLDLGTFACWTAFIPCSNHGVLTLIEKTKFSIEH